MNYNEWNNYIAIGYLKYALAHYNTVAGADEDDCRKLTDEEARRMIGCMKYAFDMKTTKEAYARNIKDLKVCRKYPKQKRNLIVYLNGFHTVWHLK